MKIPSFCSPASVTYCLFFFVFFFSCRPAPQVVVKKHAQSETIAIVPGDVPKENVMASALVDSLTYIPLETPDDALIGSIEAIYEWNGRFYIWDRQSNAVFIFSNQGKFIKKLANQGRGPKEYLRFCSLYLDPRNGHIYIHSDSSEAILHYDCEGEFVERISCKFRISGFTLAGKDSLILYGGKLSNQETFKETYPEQFRCVMMKGGDILNKELPGRYDDIFLNDVSRGKHFFYFSDTTSLIESIGNDIYRVGKDGGLTPRFSIDLGENTYPLAFETSPEEAKGIIEADRKTPGKWCDVHDVLETNDLLLIRYSFEKYGCKAFYSKRTKQIYNIGGIWLNDTDRIGMPDISGSNGDCFLGSLDASVVLLALENPDASSRIKNIAKDMDEMDNSVIVKIKMKKI